MKKLTQIILSCIESKNFRDNGTATYTYGGVLYHVARDTQGLPVVVSAEIPQEDLEQIQVIVRR